MKHNALKGSTLLKGAAAASLLAGALLFTTPVQAFSATREVNQTIPAAVNKTQVAWFYYWGPRYYRPYFYRPYYYNPYRYRYRYYYRYW